MGHEEMYSLNNIKEQLVIKGSCTNFTWLRESKFLSSSPCMFLTSPHSLLGGTSASLPFCKVFPRAAHKNSRVWDCKCKKGMCSCKALLSVWTPSKQKFLINSREALTTSHWLTVLSPQEIGEFIHPHLSYLMLCALFQRVLIWYS